MLARLEMPPSRLVLVLIALAFTLPGLAGHDLWKTFDAVTIEIVSQMLRSGDWLVPRIAGEPWLEDPPLFHWLGAMLAAVLGWVLPPHGAARLASAGLVLAAAWLLHLTARRWITGEQQRTAGATAVLVLLGSIGLIVHAHEALPDLATLAASCAVFACAAQLTHRPLVAGGGLGAALGAAFLATGPVTPLALALSAGLCALASPDWRKRALIPGFIVAAVVAVLLASSWPLLLAWRAPDLSTQWWANALQIRGSFAENLRYYVVTASWFAWPAWPLAAWAVWIERRQLAATRLLLPLLAFLVLLTGISLAGPAQDVNTIVLLPPLALLAAQGLPHLRRGAVGALDWFGTTTFTLFAGLIWLGYVAMMTGTPPKIANNFAKTAPGFLPQFDAWAFGLAVALALGWLCLALGTAPSASRSVTRWAAGVALLWGTFAALWMPWSEHLMSYRSVALQIHSRIPAGSRCIARSNVGPAQRAVLSYHTGLRTQALGGPQATRCPLLLVQGSARQETDAPGAGWSKIADVGRAGDKGERLRLYQRRP